METQRTKTWYKKFFRHLLNQAVLNSYILYKKNDDAPKLNHVQFLMKLMERLLEMYHTPKQAQPQGRPSFDSANPLRLTARHFPMYIPANSGKLQPTRRCKACCSAPDASGKKCRRESRYYCQECDVGLCAAPCFGIYHTKYKF